MQRHASGPQAKVTLIKDDAIAIIFEVTIGYTTLTTGIQYGKWEDPDDGRRSFIEGLEACSDDNPITVWFTGISETASGGWVELHVDGDDGLWTTADDCLLIGFNLRIPVSVWREVLGLMKTLLA
jgi:hypothetical protein